MTTATRRTPALKYPTGLTMTIFKDDGRWSEYRAWFMRTDSDLRTLHLTRLTLAHYEGDDEPAYTHEQWCDKADRLLDEYPNCVFIY